MDKTPARPHSVRMTIEDGFPGQRLHTIPRPQVQRALTQPGTSHLLVTDCGYFPEARAHGIFRPLGIDQAIVMVCVRGAGWCEIAGSRHEIRAGQVLVIPPGVPHSYGAAREEPWTLWWVHVMGRDLGDLLRGAAFTAEQPVRTLTDTFRTTSLVEEIVDWIEHDTTSRSVLAASGAAWHLIALLSTQLHPTSTRMELIDNARAHLREHIDKKVRVQDLAKMAGLSASRFAQLFREQVGVPVLQYQTRMRMARARELLDTTELAVSAIAQRVGYDDPFYFSRQFRSVHGITALQYRRQQKG
jgi:AraC family transcriptional regulator of arabinose operon